MQEATLKAARCAQEIHHRLHMYAVAISTVARRAANRHNSRRDVPHRAGTLNRYPAVTDSDDPKKNCYLTLHMGLGAGLITAIHVGGLYGRCACGLA